MSHEFFQGFSVNVDKHFLFEIDLIAIEFFRGEFGVSRSEPSNDFSHNEF